MSDWIEEFERTEKETSERATIEAELAVRRARHYESIAPDWWADLMSQIEHDAARLQRSISVKKDSGLLIERADPQHILCVSVRPKLDAQQVRVAYSHSDNGITFDSDGVEVLKLAVNESGHIEAYGHGAPFRLIADLSRYLLMQVLNPENNAVHPPRRGWLC
jgi:hypothetical protein